MVNRYKVLEYINNAGFVSIANLCEKFSISESTARRILHQLSSSGEVQRYHGGAISIHKNDLTNASSRITTNMEIKQRIAEKASKMVKDGQTIIMLSGSTVYHLSRYIKDKKITVITNSLLVFDELKARSNIQLILLGGYYNHIESETAGFLTNSSPSFFRADFLFMGTSGFDEFSGFTNQSYSIDIYRACLSACRQACVLTDSSKYNHGGTSVAAKPNEISYLFCDNGLNPLAVEHFRQKFNVKVVFPEDDDP